LILVISNIANEAATSLVELFPPGAASLITASSFHQAFRGGLDVNDFTSSGIQINGTELSVSGITGVVTTISSFMPNEFYYIEPADQKYVCSEMNAFFTYFLSQLNCKKINPPTVRSFSGPNLHRIEWIKKASVAHVPIWPVSMINSKNANAEAEKKMKLTFHTCSIIGGDVIGGQPDLLRTYTERLQRIFDVPFFTCHFISENPGDYYLADMVFKLDILPVVNREAIVNYFL